MTLLEIEAIVDTFSVESTDFIGLFPIDLTKLDFCNPDGNIVEKPAMSLDDIEALCNSDFILNLLDTDKMQAKIKNMLNDITDGINGNNANDNNDNLGDTIGNYAIIEFGDDYNLGEKVSYKLNVTPGQCINENTIIGNIVQNNINKPIKSIFSKGKILSSSDNNKEFLHLFPSKASRHIIIADYQLSDGIGYNDKVFTEIGNEINNNTDLYNFIKDNLCLSTLPIFLKNHETKEEHEKCPHTDLTWCNYQGSASAVTQYNNLMKKYEDVLDNGGKKFKDIASAKKIKATKGKNSGMHKIKDAVLELREKILNDIITLYTDTKKYTLKLPYYMTMLSTIGYEDCLNLCNIQGSKNNYENINNKPYNNYYMYLLSQIDYDTDNEIIKLYRAILISIINKRSLYEASTKQDIITEFNNLFKTHIRTYTSDEIKNDTLGYNIVSIGANNEFTLENIKSLLNMESNTALLSAIDKAANDYITILKTNNDYLNTKLTLINEFNQYYKSHIEFDIDTVDTKYKTAYTILYSELSNTTDKDKIIKLIKERVLEFNKRPTSYKKQFIYKRLANIYLYINDLTDADDIEEKLEFTDDYTVYNLIEEEYNLLINFWDTTIKTYKSKTVADIINGINKEADKLAQYAEWPTPSTITIEELEYLHYLFKNPVRSINDSDYTEAEDDSINGYDENKSATAPEVPENPDIGVSDAEAENAELNLDDDSDEISVTDTEYWVRYFTLATIISLPPIFWASGFDIPPAMIPVPMPGIYIAIKAIHIKMFNIVIVIGLAIRGIYIYPILLVLNLSDLDLSPLTPLIALLNKIKDMYKAGISLIEQTIPNVIGLIIYKLQMENQLYILANQKFEALLLLLLNLVVQNDELLKRHMNQLVNSAADIRQKISRPLEELSNE